MAFNLQRKMSFMRNCDRISSLPDDILCRILTFLPTKDSVRTAALSTRWKYLFTLVPVLDFEYFRNTTQRRNKRNEFVNFVYRVLVLYNVPNMRRFNLNYYQPTETGEDSHVHSWVSAAIRRNVCDMYIRVYPYHPVKLPSDICISKTLVYLKVMGSLILTLVDSMFLPSLKTLHLMGVTVIIGESKRLSFSTCPVLEDLWFNCQEIHPDSNVIDISVLSLKRLILYLPPNTSSLVLNAPALEFFNFLNRVTFPMMSDLPSYQNLTRLKLGNLQTAEWKVLVDLLDRAPNLEYLTFEYGLVSYDEMGHVPTVRECVCLSQHLKEIEIGTFFGIEGEFKLVECLLKNAKVLKKMIIRSTEPLGARYKIIEKLLALPRYSRDCQVVLLNKSNND